MATRSRAPHQAVEEAVAELLSQLAGHLVAAGVSYRRFAGISRLAYFTAASHWAKFGNDRLNQSAIAAMTGLTRVQVRQFAKQVKPAPPRTRDLLSELVDGWSTDPSFLTAGKKPRRLRIDEGRQSFKALVQRYGGDIPTRAVLKELQRHGYVTVQNGHVALNQLAKPTNDEVRLRRITSALTDLVRDEKGPTGRGGMRTMSLEVTYPPTSDKGRTPLQRRITRNLEAFVAGVEAAGIAASLDSPPPTSCKSAVTRTRVVLITEDIESSPTERR